MSEPLFNKRDQCGVGAGICSFIIIIGFIISYAVYFCYSIYALSQVSDKTIRNTCEDSILWRYVLVSILVPAALGNTSKNNEKETLPATIFCWFAASLIMTVFGCIEFIENDCEDEFENSNKKELLYNIGKMGFGMYFSISVFLFTGMFIYSGFICLSLKEISSVEQQVIDKTHYPDLQSSVTATSTGVNNNTPLPASPPDSPPPIISTN